MSNIYFYITGILTSFFAILSWHYSKNNRSLKDNIALLNKENKKLKEFKEKRQSKKRSAVFTWGGWYSKDDPSTKWEVTFNLIELASSDSDPNLYRFSVDSVFSHGKDKNNEGFYTQEFMSSTGGGWLDIAGGNNKKFNWVVSDSKEALRDDKLEELGI